ncbi:c-type cytochrome [Sulfitobacter sp. JB4-11]|uniref:c-type cytochrome n=1 Tax=Sulfitobacter rhodophyticola TaxID=3238304 RepID=UPI00351701B2
MFDTMTLTKLASGLLGAWLVLLLGKWVGEEVYHAEAHGEQSYAIEIEGAEEEEPEEELDFAALMDVADPASGERVFRKCSACHKIAAGENNVGPYLHGVVGRQIAAVDGFNYSGALADIDAAWTPDELSAFLENPKGYAPGTTMGFAGLKKPEERADLIAYLDTLDD